VERGEGRGGGGSEGRGPPRVQEDRAPGPHSLPGGLARKDHRRRLHGWGGKDTLRLQGLAALQGNGVSGQRGRPRTEK